MHEARITACAIGGAGLSAVPTTTITRVDGDAIARFATRHRKALRYLNRGAIVTAALVDAVLTARWPDADERPARLGLVVGSAFGNQGETARYFRDIAANGPDQVGPMASYDVAVNSFVSFCSIFFGCRGPVAMVSSGTVSGVDALLVAGDLCADDAADAVIVAATEVDGPETRAYSDDASDTIELGAALLLERGGTGAALLAADTGFADPAGANAAAQLRRLGDRLLAGIGAAPSAVRVVAPAAPDEAIGFATAHRRWIPGLGGAGVARVGALLDDLATAGDGGLGVALASDRNGWIGAAVVAGRVPAGSPARRVPAGGDLTCPR